MVLIRNVTGMSIFFKEILQKPNSFATGISCGILLEPNCFLEQSLVFNSSKIICSSGKAQLDEKGQVYNLLVGVMVGMKFDLRVKKPIA